MKRFNESRIKSIDDSSETLLNPSLQAFHEEVSNVLKILSHDLRGSLVSISATLKLLNTGYYGKWMEKWKRSAGSSWENVPT